MSFLNLSNEKKPDSLYLFTSEKQVNTTSHLENKFLNHELLHPFIEYVKSSIDNKAQSLQEIASNWELFASADEFTNPSALTNLLYKYDGRIISPSSYVLSENAKEASLRRAFLALSDHSFDILSVYSELNDRGLAYNTKPDILFSQSYEPIKDVVEKD